MIALYFPIMYSTKTQKKKTSSSIRKREPHGTLVLIFIIELVESSCLMPLLLHSWIVVGMIVAQDSGFIIDKLNVR